MQKIIFGVFAHPDDEAFGPGGTLLSEVRAGSEVHLVTLTLGEAGTNPDGHSDLAAVREQEWRTAGALIGATTMNFFGYNDGRLCNADMIEIGQKIVALVQRTTKGRDDIEIEFMTLDLNGMTGHIDHIVAARAACWAFYQLKAAGTGVTRLRLACLSRRQAAVDNVEWIYMEAGRASDEINETIDARQYHDEIIAMMRAHHSQREDGETHIAARGSDLGTNYFIVKT